MKPAHFELFKCVVSKSIQLKRLEHKFTQAQVAQAVGVPTYQVADWESGRCRVPADRIYELSILFDCDVSEFFPHEKGEQ